MERLTEHLTEKEQQIKQQPAAKERPAKQQPAAKEQPAKQQPAAKERSAKQQPAAKERSAKQQPAAKEQPAKQQPAAKERLTEQRPEEQAAEKENLTARNRLKTTLCGIELDNPVIPASGTFGYGYEFAQLYDINLLGTFSFKGTTRDPRFGNPTPRIAECTAGMINAVGLQNPGVEKVIAEELPELKKCFHKKVMANVSGFSAEDYAYTCEKLDKEDQVGWLEVNISCPNVHGGGMSFGTDPAAAASVVRAVKKVTTKPVIIKLTPNVTDIVSIAKACEDAGADGISLINTVLGMRIDLKKKKPVIANTMGGFSGPAIFPLALRMVYQVSGAVKIPVVGMGGVSCAEDVIEMMLAGACAVEIGAMNLTDPFICKKIIENLPAVMDRYGIGNLKDITGGAHNG